MNPFVIITRAKNYGDIRAALFWVRLVAALGATAALRGQVTPVDDALDWGITESVDIAGVPVSLGLFVPAALLALAFHLLDFHDRVSDLLAQFDVHHILRPLAFLSCSPLPDEHALQMLHKQRHELMRRTYYKYASSGEGAAKIDTHAIREAIDTWKWYWIMLELAVLSLGTALISAVFGGPTSLTASPLLAALVFLVLMRLQLIRCQRRALRQIVLILDDADRRVEVGGAFREISGQRP